MYQQDPGDYNAACEYPACDFETYDWLHLARPTIEEQEVRRSEQVNSVHCNRNNK